MTENELKEAKQRIELAIASLDKQYGKGSVIRLGNDDIQPWPSVSTGALTLDLALGVGGLPKGRIVEVYGPESSGKSTLCLNVVAEAQRLGGICAYVDAENAIDPIYAKNLGVDLDELLICQPDYGEMALEVVDKLIETEAIDVIIVDSVAALTPKAELEGEMGQSHMGLQARLMGQMLRKITKKTADTKCLVIFTNQLREKIGVMFGNPETTPGGKALRFYASVRLDLRKKDLKDSKNNVVGAKVTAKVIKNKMAPPLKVCEFDILWGKGIDSMGCIVDLAIDRGILVWGGAWLKYNGDVFAQGRTNAIEKLNADPDLAEQLRKEINSA